MEQSPSVSITQESLSKSISHNSSENSLTKSNKLIKWCRIVKFIIRFFRFIKIPQLRSRFIDVLNYIRIDDNEIEGFKNYQTNKVQEDLLFLDDVKNYREVFNTFVSFGFIWHDREFHMARLKAHYIYDRYMLTSETIAKTNIPIDTIPIINNRIASPRVLSSMIYLNLFNDAEKFLIEKLLLIYMRQGLNYFSIRPQKQSITIMNRCKENRIKNESNLSLKYLKELKKQEKSISNRPTIKLKDKMNKESQYDEFILPNWTYSTDLGFFYNPIHEKRLKTIRNNSRRKAKGYDSNARSTVKSDQESSNTMTMFDSTITKPMISVVPSRISSRIHQQPIDNKLVSLISKNKTLLPDKKRPSLLHAYHRSFHNPNRFSSFHYHQYNHIADKNMFDKQQFSRQIFICKVHSVPWSDSYRLNINNDIPYKIIRKHELINSFNRIEKLQ